MIDALKILEEVMVEHVTPTFPDSPHRAITAVRWYLNNDPECKKGLLLGIQEIIKRVLDYAGENAILQDRVVGIYADGLEVNQQSIINAQNEVVYD